MSTHAEISTLAELADGTLPSEQAGDIRAHLAECRSCMAPYVDAVRYRAAWLADSDAFKPDRHVLELARMDRSPEREAARAGVGSPRSRAADRSFRWQPALAVAAVLMVALVLTGRGWFARSPSVGFALPPAVREATEWSSSRGLVLPGGERTADRVQPGLRSGQDVSSPALDREVRSSIADYERGPRRAVVGARLVASLLAVGEIDAARDYAREALEAHPDDVPLLVYAADAHYRSNDLASAEELLRRAVMRAPGDPIASLDLALVLRQQARDDEADELLARVERAKVRALAERARRERAQSR